MRGIFTTICVFLCTILTINAQDCDPLSPPDVAAPGCGCAFPDCNVGLSNFTGLLGVPPGGTQAIPECTGGNGVFNNDDWIAFIAGSQSISITITPSNCDVVGGLSGVQAGFYSNCTSSGGTDEGIPSGGLLVQCNCSTAPLTLDYDDFVCGQTYYIFVDGCGGSVCDYTITVNSGSTTLTPPDPLTAVGGPASVCDGATVTYSVNEVFCVPDYDWTITGSGTIVSESGNTVTVQWTSPGGSISATGSNFCYTTNTTLPYNVTVMPLPPIFETGEYCDDEPGYTFPINGQLYTQGTWNIDVPITSGPDEGCSQPYVLTVTRNPTYNIIVNRTICFGEQVVYGGLPYSVGGSYDIPGVTALTQCDSNIMLNLTVLDPLAFVNLPPSPLDEISCTNPTVSIDGSQSFPAQDIENYDWSSPTGGTIESGLGTPFITVSTAGTYCLLVSYGQIDGESGLPVYCSSQACIDVLDNLDPPTLSVSSTSVNCPGADDGTATVSISGGQGPFLIAWNDGPPNSTTETATGLSGGTYTVSVFSLTNGCTASETIFVPESAGMVLDMSSEDSGCAGATTGTATVMVSGGAPNYTYLWNTTPIAQTTATATGLAGGTYTVIVTDASNCTMENSVTVGQGSEVTATAVGTNIDCNGDATGTATATGMGGTGVYTYSWNTTPIAQTTQTATSLTAGVYTVIVTDENNCDATATVTITEPDPLALVMSSTDASCGGNADGTATVAVSGGTPNYTYSWNTTPVAQTTPTATGLTAGVYTVIVTDANSCTSTDMVTVIEPSGVMVTTDSVDVSCFGGNDGEASVVATGGSGVYDYVWSTSPVQITATATGLTAGVYMVTIEDENDCQVIETITVNEPTEIILVESGINSDCAGANTGEVSVSVSGGTPGYTYEWDTSPPETTATVTGLGAGTYTVVVTDDNDCTATVSVTITEASAMVLVESGVNVSCFDGNDGEVSVSVSGGTPGYTYEWDTSPVSTTATVTGLGAGTYTVVVTDDNDCTATVSVTITEPTELTAMIVSMDPACSTSTDGEATVTADGGTPGYMYEWDTSPIQNTATAIGLSAGTYTVIVTDDNDCTVSETIILVAPNALSLSTTQVNILCTGESTGEATIIPTGGTPPLSFSWDDAASQVTATATGLPAGPVTGTVTDDNGCTEMITVTITEPALALSVTGTSTDAPCGSTSGTIDLTVDGGVDPYSFDWGTAPIGNVEDPGGLGAGTYTVIVTDANDCTATTTVTVNSPDSPSAMVTITDASCNGAADGTMDVTVTGGTVGPAGYTFLWNPSSNDGNEDLAGVVAGSYSVTISDDVGCSVVANGVIAQPDSLMATATATPASCGIDDGSISTVVSGGTIPYSFDWPGTPPYDGMQSPTGLAAGTYEVTITDGNGCTVLADATVIIPNGPTTTIVGTNVDCNGNETGTVIISTTGGLAPYVIDWGNPIYNGLDTLNDLPAGTYSVIVTDVNNCSSTAQIDVLEPDPLVITTSSTPVSCAGLTDGTASVTIVGGTGPFEVLWCDGQTGEQVVGCPAGPCTVTVIDVNGCIIEGSVDVGEPAPLVASAVPSAVDCNGASTGGIEVTVNGGTGDYSFAWTGGVIGDVEDPTGLPAGTYEVIVSDDNGCTTEITDIVITEPDAMTITFTTVDATCNQNNGSIDITVMGGTGTYTYSWTGGLGVVEDPTGVATGSYDVVVTDENDCTITETIVVSTPDALIISSVPTDVDCNGANTGSIEVTLSGGMMPYTYLWDDADGQVVEDAIGLVAGTYILLVIDANNCTITTTATVNEPTAIVLSSTSTPATCNESNGTIDLTVSGGTGGYNYSWTGGPGDVQDPTGLSSGSYDVTVSDANGCTAVLTESVNTPSGLSATVVAADANCFGENNGSIDLTVVGGMMPYTYVWDDLAGQIIQDPIDLIAGVYNVVVTDGDGCTIVASGTVNQPDLLTANGTSADASCNQANGSINLTVNGGVEPYVFAWTGTTQTIEDPIGLPSGSYDVMVTDANGCTVDANVIVTEPDPLVLSIVPTDALCNGDPSGSIELGVIGGTGAGTYTYQWDDADGQTVEDPVALTAGMYTVIVTDANDCTISETTEIFEPLAIDANGTSTPATCNESNGTIDLTVIGGTMPYTFAWSGTPQTIEDPQNLPAGTYDVTVTDDNDCTFITAVTINTPSALTAIAVPADALCNGEASGSIDLMISGGTAPYTVSWTGGLGMDEDPMNVPAGGYLATITDADDCQIFTGATVGEPTLIESSFTSVDATCNASNGSIDLTVNGGTIPYTFAWDGGADPVEDPQGLTTGTYNVTITDGNSCTSVLQAVVNTPGAAMISSTSEDVSCNGDADGSIDLIVDGGIAPFTYSWSNGPSMQDLDGLTAGMYTVTISDGNGCTTTSTINIDQPSPLEAADQLPTQVSCNGGNNGSALIVPTGGTAPYTFDWNDNVFDGQDAPSTLSSGMYSVTVTDGNGCTTVVDDIEITEPPALALSTSSVATACFGTSDGAIDLTVNGGTAPYTFDWNSGAFVDEDPQNVTAGNYTVVVTDANGCTQTTNVQVDQPTAVLLNIVNVSNYGGTNVTCSDATDGSAEAAAVGGSGGYTYAWSTGDVTPQVENLAAGVYQVIATDVNGCTAENEVLLEAPLPVALATDIMGPSCYAENDAVVITDGSGGTGPYMYALDGAAFSGVNVFAGLTSGAYDITVQDANGCEEAVEALVSDPAELIVDLGDDIEIQLGDSTQLEVISSIPAFAFDTLIWTRDLLGLEPWVAPLQTTNYQVTIADSLGCTATDDIVVRVNKDRLVFIPNIFTPNDDGQNDVFQIYVGTGVKEVSNFRVFNRWGEIVYEAENILAEDVANFFWDGKFRGELLNPAVFVYLAEVEFVDGRVELFKGDVTLMR